MYGILVRNIRLVVPYTASGVTGFLIDLALFWVFLHIFELHYLVATSLGFVSGTSVHFLISRFAVFTTVHRSLHAAYVYFLSIGLLGLMTISGLMYLAVDLLHTDAFGARVLIGTIVGLMSFMLHKKITFRYREIHV